MIIEVTLHNENLLAVPSRGLRAGSGVGDGRLRFRPFARRPSYWQPTGLPKPTDMLCSASTVFLKQLSFWSTCLNPRSYCIQFWSFSFSWVPGRSKIPFCTPIWQHGELPPGRVGAEAVSLHLPGSQGLALLLGNQLALVCQDCPAFSTESPVSQETLGKLRPQVTLLVPFMPPPGPCGHARMWPLPHCLLGAHIPKMTSKAAHHLNPASPPSHAIYFKLLFTPLALAQTKGAFFYPP